MAVSGPTVVRRQLGRRLRKLREQARKTEMDVQNASLMSRTKLWRIEGGQVAVGVPDVRALCWFYGVGEDLTSALAGQAIGTSERGWWERHGDVVPQWFKLFIGMEGAASHIQAYDGELIPGLLQTEDYARAVHAAAQPEDGDEDTLQRLVAVRRERQEALLQRNPVPKLTVVLGAGALDRKVGGAVVMRAQRAHLRELGQLPHVEIAVLANGSGAHAAMTGAFWLLDFSDAEDPAVVYLESHVGGHYLEKENEVGEYRRIFDLIRREAVPIEEYR